MPRFHYVPWTAPGPRITERYLHLASGRSSPKALPAEISWPMCGRALPAWAFLSFPAERISAIHKPASLGIAIPASAQLFIT
jgi:hypothetical protein